MRQHGVVFEHERCIGIIKQTMRQVLDDGGTGQAAVQDALDAVGKVRQLILDKGTEDVDGCSEAVLEAAFAPGEDA